MSISNNSGRIYGMNNGPRGSISFGRSPNSDVADAQADTSTAISKILVIDGGGLRGLSCLMIIDEIMKAVMMRSLKYMLPCDVFDLICGTSVGGFITVLLGRLGLDCTAAIEYYEKSIKMLLKDEHDIVWDKIAESNVLDTVKFREYLKKISNEKTGLPKPPMNVAASRNLVQHSSTKTFATVMEGGSYPTSCYPIRSYTPQRQQNLSASVNLQWNVPDAIMATMASPIYMAPLRIRNDNQCRFKDAGFAGYNNPVLLALDEWKNNFPGGKIGTIISLGTGLGDLLPQSRPSSGDQWKPSPQYVMDLCRQFFKEKFPMTEGDEDVELEIRRTARDLICVAADSNVTHQKFNANSAAYCDNYYRIDESFGLDRFDLVDVYQPDIIRDNINKWLKDGGGSQLIDKIASQLVEKNDKPQDKSFATFVTPPPPPPDTIEGYSPLMDKPRPTRIQDYLRYYEVMFIVDDSGSMKRSRWSEARDALLDIADHAFQLQTHTVSMRFMNHSTYVRGLQGSAKLKSIFDSVKPRGPTPTGEVLKSVFDEHLEKIEAAISRNEYPNVPPLDIIVITDGEPTDKVADIIADTVVRLKNKHYHPNTMGVQFVQIGNDPDAIHALKELIKEGNGNMIDTVPYRGKLSADALKRVLLGGMHPNVRATLPVELLGV